MNLENPNELKSPPKTFEDVLEDELESIRGIAREGEKIAPAQNAYNKASKANLVGLALSGGGIRSATFNLGVLQGLASLGILPKIDYISTVSGGGYIGNWLTALLYRKKDLSDVIKILDPTKRAGPSDKEPKEIRRLRDYSNYLTPRKGAFSMDLWTVIVTYIRNLSLNLTILFLALTALLILPHLFLTLYYIVSSDLSGWSLLWPFVLFEIACIAMIANLSNLTGGNTSDKEQVRYQTSSTVLVTVIGPIFLGAFLLNHWLWAHESILSEEWYVWALYTGVAYAVIWGLGSYFGYLLRPEKSERVEKPNTAREALRQYVVEPYHGFAKRARLGITEAISAEKRWDAWTIFISAFFAGSVGGVLLMLVADLINSMSDNYVRYMILGVPLIIVVLKVITTLHIGLVGNGFSEQAREWWSRLGADLALITASLTTLFAIAVFGEEALDQIAAIAGKELFQWLSSSAVTGWILTTAAGIFAGRSPKTGTDGNSAILEVIGKIAPYVFIIGLSLLLDQLALIILRTNFFGLTIGDSVWLTSASAAAMFSVAALLSWRIGINDFSMHAMYRNRLVRCYLGASNEKRNAQPFIDFDPGDDNIRIQDLLQTMGSNKCQRPYPIVNTALNLVKGKKLAWQQRKATSFIFTPLYSGYDYTQEETNARHNRSLQGSGYRDTDWYGNTTTLGNVMAISGAAASPNMGYHTSPSLAFLMTIFNVRLGWWLGNTRFDTIAKERGGPVIGLFYLFFELFGTTDDTSRYVYLSDGGHFENLGLYELVRRRCRLIIVSDAGEDPKMKFADLGNAVEKCRTDFGIDIDINVEDIRTEKNSGISKCHCAIGKIHYDKVDPKAPNGKMIYLKSSIDGSEPIDVLRYKAQHKEFPHQSTADQWFDESQFESYRQLGYSVLQSASQFLPSRLWRIRSQD